MFACICPYCQKQLTFHDSYYGFIVDCPNCNKEITLPQEGIQPVTQAPAKAPERAVPVKAAAPVKAAVPVPAPVPVPVPAQAVGNRMAYVNNQQNAEQVNMFTALQKYAQFYGRARRSEFWLFWLLGVAVNVLINVLVFGCIALEFGELILLLNGLSWIIQLALIIPSLAVAVRRLHDTGRSGWNILLGLIPCAGFIILLIFYCQDSQPGSNIYGPNPKGMN